MSVISHLVDAMNAVAIKVLDNTSAFLQALGILMLFLSFITVLMGWIFFPERNLKIPLLVFGVLAIVLLVVINQKGFVLGVSLLIIGTVVASEEFLLTVTSLMRVQSGEVTGILRTYTERTVTLPSTSSVSQETVQRIVSEAILREFGQSNTPAAQQRVEKILTEGQVEIARQKVDMARIPLMEVVRGGPGFQSFVREYKGKDFFERDMASLQREGLITCERGDLTTCKPTELGRRVVPLDLPSVRERIFRSTEEPDSKAEVGKKK